MCIIILDIIFAFRTHELPKFHYWCWGTITGVTGIFLTIVTGLIFVCSLSMVRKSFYNWFSLIHSLYPVFYILMILHGSGRLVQVILLYIIINYFYIYRMPNLKYASIQSQILFIKIYLPRNNTT